MFNLTTLRDYESRGLVKSSSRDGFTVWCYTQRCVAERAWDDVTKSCRGLVLSPNGELVSRPLPKFHNWNEPEAVLEDTAFYAFDKMDGTLIVVGNHDENAIVSTKGSFDTWHSEAARERLLGWTPPEGVTGIFELIHPDNRVVVDYNGYDGLVFLTAVDNETGADLGRPDVVGTDLGWHGDIVVERRFHLRSMLKTIQNPESGPNREGFVVVWPRDGEPWNRVKLKFDLYVKLHGIYTGLTNRRVWECLVDDTLQDLMELAPDELHADIDACAEEILSRADELFSEAAQVGYEARLESSRKDAAEMIMSRLQRPVAGLAFKVYDGKEDQAHLEALRHCRPDESKFVGSAGLS